MQSEKVIGARTDVNRLTNHRLYSLQLLGVV